MFFLEFLIPNSRLNNMGGGSGVRSQKTSSFNSHAAHLSPYFRNFGPQ